MFSGMMLSQYTADHLIVGAAHPVAPIGPSIPAAADQEDFVSMGMNTAIKNGQILDKRVRGAGDRVHGRGPGVDFREFKFGEG